MSALNILPAMFHSDDTRNDGSYFPIISNVRITVLMASSVVLCNFYAFTSCQRGKCEKGIYYSK